METELSNATLNLDESAIILMENDDTFGITEDIDEIEALEGEEFEKGLFLALDSFDEKNVPKRHLKVIKSQSKVKKDVVTTKTTKIEDKVPANDSNVPFMEIKMSRKERYANIKENCTSTTAIQTYNKETKKNEIFIEVSGNLELVYTYVDRHEWSYGLINAFRKRGKLLEVAGCDRIHVVSKDGQEYDAVKGVEFVVTGAYLARIFRAVFPKSSAIETSSTFKEYEITVYGGSGTLQNLQKVGTVVGDSAGFLTVRFDSKTSKISFCETFSKKTGETKGSKSSKSGQSWTLKV